MIQYIGDELQLSLPNGTSITSANEICRYLCSEAGQKSFYLDGTADQALADRWMNWEANKLQVYAKIILITHNYPSVIKI